jgi:hypothetical protein
MKRLPPTRSGGFSGARGKQQERALRGLLVGSNLHVGAGILALGAYFLLRSPDAKPPAQATSEPPVPRT